MKPQVNDIQPLHEHDKQLEGLAELPYLERVTQFIRGSTRHSISGGGSIVDFRPLYSVTIHHLQKKLAQEIRSVRDKDVTEDQLERIRDLLQQYNNALKDFELIHSNRWNTLFLRDIAASRIDDRPGSKLLGALISDLGLEVPESYSSIFHDSDLLGSFDHDLMHKSAAIGQSLGSYHAQRVGKQQNRERIKQASWRLAFAILGGLIIVIPMLILVSDIAPLKSQVVISVSIFLFAVSVACFSNTVPENLLVATAAYAAVLVTFLGNTR